MTTVYEPACPACRVNDSTTFYRLCSGCTARKAQIESNRRAASQVTQKQVDGMDSTMQPLKDRK